MARGHGIATWGMTRTMVCSFRGHWGLLLGRWSFTWGFILVEFFLVKNGIIFFSFKICKLLCKKVVTCVGWVCNSAPKLVCALFFKQRCESSEPICYLSYKSPIRVFFRVYTLITWEKSWSKIIPKAFVIRSP